MSRRNEQNNLYKSAKFHLWALAGCIIFTLFLELITRGRIFTGMFLHTFAMLVLQMELFAWIGMKIFSTLAYKTVGQFARRVLLRLGLFYLIILFISLPIFYLVATINGAASGQSFVHFFLTINQSEARGVVIASSFGLLFGTLIYFFIELTSVIKREIQLSEEKLRYQYETLKNQMNPHFLFNSLNTLSSIIYQDVNLADKFIGKLSSTYRYILDNRDSQLVPLSRELAFVNDYFYLQQLRDGHRIALQIEVDNPDRFYILPVSLQLLVENALKHNSATAENPLKIDITLEDNRFIVVRNNRQPKQQIEGSFQIGLNNLRERVKMITGKELMVEALPTIFTVKIPLS